MAVLSNKPHEETLKVISSLFGNDIFDMVVGQSEDRKIKPSPEGVFYILESLGMTSSDLLYLGDTATDMKTGKSGGAFTIGVLWGFRKRDELEMGGADPIISHPMEVLEYLE